MRSVWSCSSCAVLLLFAVLGREASASHAGRQWKDVVHRVPKALVTAHPARRDEGSCPTEHISCAASLSGGCCPSRYACAVDSCYATTAGPTTACGREAWFACAPVNGEVGCCPVGYVCGNGGDCLPPAGATNTNTECPSDYYLCPASVNYGCCMSGLGCAPNACYATEPVTTTMIQTITTTSGSETVTTTRTAVTVATPTPPAGFSDNTGVAAKFIPTSVPKVPVTSDDDSGGGLSGGAIGGIIAGVVVLLIVVVVAAFLIIRRLKRVEDIMESKRGSSSGKKTRSQSQAQMEHYGRQLHSDMDDMSVDPLMVAPSTTTNNNSVAATPQPGVDPRARGRVDSSGAGAGFTPSPNMFGHPTGDDRSRHASPDSNVGYFDIPTTRGQHQQQPMQQAPIRGSVDSAGTTHRGYAYTHWRQQSNASELSADGSDNGFNATVNSPLVGGGGNTSGSGGGPIQELDGSAGFVELPSGGGGDGYTGAGNGPYTPGMSPSLGGGGVRSRSNSNTSVRGHARRRSDGVAGPGQAQQASQPPVTGLPGATGATGATGLGLTPLDEAAEMHGYYGRADQQAGQTAAGLEPVGGLGGHGGLGQQQQQQWDGNAGYGYPQQRQGQ